ncbi:hypothetical protein [Comamonas testosteroni]|uniref:hypothetical protein n=1 Tax=Comamonas testosteroni TaxID=285 RepID=UPI0026EABD4D|nr:hypothetical protein [Comamonas testosteroni]
MTGCQQPKGCDVADKGIYFIYTNGAPMTQVAKDTLLVKFRAKDTNLGVTRGTVKEMAKELDLNETQVIHMALSKFAAEILPAYEPDDGPLTAKQLKALRKDAQQHMPKGKTLSKEALFA